jgi:predicted 3-demethylubiquinone-9 3-methyltransferase (glyoxalase superfamily)
MPAIYPFLWFDHQAEEAAKFYVSIFPNSKIRQVTHYTAAGPLPEGTVLTVDFELDGKPMVALNGGPTSSSTRRSRSSSSARTRRKSTATGRR